MKIKLLKKSRRKVCLYRVKSGFYIVKSKTTITRTGIILSVVQDFSTYIDARDEYITQVIAIAKWYSKPTKLK